MEEGSSISVDEFRREKGKMTLEPFKISVEKLGEKTHKQHLRF